MADETGTEDVLKGFYDLIGATMQRAETTFDVVGAQLRVADSVPGLATAAKLTRGLATGK